MTRRLAVVGAAAPGIVVSTLGLVHPTELGPDTAATWWQLHVVLLPLFPLLGAALVVPLRGAQGLLVWLARVGAYVFATFYTGLDTLAGIGAGLAVAAQPAGSPVALDLIRLGDRLGSVGTTGLLVAALATAIVVVRRDGAAAAPGAVLVVGAAAVFRHSHIYWPVGGLTVLALGLGCGLLAWRSSRPPTPTTAGSLTR